MENYGALLRPVELARLAGVTPKTARYNMAHSLHPACTPDGTRCYRDHWDVQEYINRQNPGRSRALRAAERKSEQYQDAVVSIRNGKVPKTVLPHGMVRQLHLENLDFGPVSTGKIRAHRETLVVNLPDLEIRDQPTRADIELARILVAIWEGELLRPGRGPDELEFMVDRIAEVRVAHGLH